MKAPLYSLIARNLKWSETVSEDFKKDQLIQLARLSKLLPRGSGFDAGCQVCLNSSKPNKIVILFSFHHMDENGFYTKWTDHKATITPDLVDGFNLKITKNGASEDLMDHLHETLYWDLMQVYIKEETCFVMVSDSGYRMIPA